MTRVAVVGLGSVGAQALKALAETPGVEAVGFEQFTPGHDRGAAGGDARIFRHGQLAEQEWVPIAQHAAELWERLERDTGRQLRHFVGCLMIGSPASAGIRQALDGNSQYDLGFDVLSREEAMQRFPQYSLNDDDVALFDRNAGYIRSEQTILATTLLAERLGATIHRQSQVLDVLGTESGARVVTAGGSHDFDRVIVTTGPWATTLMPELRELITIKRPVSAWYTTKFGKPLPTNDPTVIHTSPDDLYTVPGSDGLTVKLGLSGKDHDVVDSPDTTPRQVEARDLVRFTEMLERFFPNLHPEPVRMQSYFEGYTSDARPIVQASPASENVILLVGFSGAGFKFSSAMGDVGAKLALGERPPVDLAFLRR